MAKINFNLTNIGQRLAKNLSRLFFGGFLLLVLFEAFEINASVQIILESGEAKPAIVIAREIELIPDRAPRERRNHHRA
mgnify:CR=1 FL=1